MKVLVFTGMPFAGKSMAVAIAKSLGHPVVRMGDFVWEETKRQGRPLTDAEVGATASAMRESLGKDVWARRTVDAVRKLSNEPLVVIDGARNPEEIRYFQQALATDVLVIAIAAPAEQRWHRAQHRGRADDMTTLAQFEERDRRETGWGLSQVIEEADIVVENATTPEQFKKTVADTLALLAAKR